ncbi:MAG TPA: hypothetical protein VIU43_00435 [Nitrosospira sp.]
MRYLLRCDNQDHRAEKHSHLEDRLAHLPADGLGDMCTWEQFCRLRVNRNAARSALMRALPLATLPMN